MGGTIRFPKVITLRGANLSALDCFAVTPESRWGLISSSALAVGGELFFPKLAGDDRSNVSNYILP